MLTRIMHTRVKRTEMDKRPSPTPYAVINHIVCDSSYSMTSFNGAQVTMIHDILTDAKTSATTMDVPYYITLTTFTGVAKVHLKNIDMREYVIPSIETIREMLTPNGTTRFIDTVLESIAEIDLQKQTIRASMTRECRGLDPPIISILNCITDGFDNSSVQPTALLRNTMLDYREKGGVAMLMAANMNAQIIGAKYGFSEDVSLTIDNTPGSIRFASDCVRRLQREISTGGPYTPYTSEERTISNKSSTIMPLCRVPLSRLTTEHLDFNFDNDLIRN